MNFLKTRTVKKMRMPRIFIVCIHISVILDLCSRCAAISERSKRPLIYTDGSTGRSGVKHFIPNDPPVVSARHRTLSRTVNRNTLSFQTSKFLHRWGNETNILLIGGKDHVYMLSGVLEDEESELTYHKLLTWKSPADQKGCVTVPNRNKDHCENYIRFIELMENGELLVCGSNSFNPACRYYSIDQFSTSEHGNSPFVREDKCRGPCPVPPSPSSSSVSLYSETNTGYQIFSALVDTDNSPIIMRNVGPTLFSDTLWLKEPTFLKIIEFKNYVYIFFREVAEEYESGKDGETYARVARVCKNDEGGFHALLNRWTTFIKARLICDKSGQELNTFNNLTSVSDIVSIPDKSDNVDNVVFATFTSPWNWEETSMSAVCAYSMNDIASVIDAGRLLGTYEVEVRPNRDPRYNIPPPPNVPLKKRSYPFQPTETRRIRKCRGDDDVANIAELNFANDFYLLYDSAKPKFGQPLYITNNFRATQIQVDYNAGRNRHIMIYVGSEDGKVLRLRNTMVHSDEWKMVLVESISVLKEDHCINRDCGVRSLHISRPEQNARPSLFVAFPERLVQMPIARCNAYKMRECCNVDPDCEWNRKGCVERRPENENTLSLIPRDDYHVPEECKASGMMVAWNYDCNREQDIPDGLAASIPQDILNEVYQDSPTTTITELNLKDIIISSTSGSLEEEFRATSTRLGIQQIQSMKEQLGEAVASTIRLVLENHKQEYCLPSPAVNQLVHVYPLLLKEIDLWHATALRKMSPDSFDPRCWSTKRDCAAEKTSFSLPLLRVLWEPLTQLIKNFSGHCELTSKKPMAAFRPSPTPACVPLPGLDKCKNDINRDCKAMTCSFMGYAVDPRAFFRHANDTRHLFNPSTAPRQPAPLWKPVNETLTTGQRAQGHLEVVVSNSKPFSIYYSPVDEKVKIVFHYKPVKCSELDSLVDNMFMAAFKKMNNLRKCTKEINKKNRLDSRIRRANRRHSRHRSRSRRSSDLREPNLIYDRPSKCKYIITRPSNHLTASDAIWEDLIARSQKSGGIYERHQQIIRFTGRSYMMQFFKNDCPTNTTSERTTFIRSIPKKGLVLTPLVSSETPFVIKRSKQKITLKFFCSKTYH